VPIHSLHAQSSATAATVHPASRIGAASPGRPSSIGGSSPSISVLGKALAEAVQRAEKRDKESSPAELKALAERTGRNVFDGDWQRGGDIGGVEHLNDLPAIEKTFFAEGYLDRLHSLIASSEMPDSPIDVASPTMTSLRKSYESLFVSDHPSQHSSIQWRLWTALDA